MHLYLPPKNRTSQKLKYTEDCLQVAKPNCIQAQACCQILKKEVNKTEEMYIIFMTVTVES